MAGGRYSCSAYIGIVNNILWQNCVFIYSIHKADDKQSKALSLPSIYILFIAINVNGSRHIRCCTVSMAAHIYYTHFLSGSKM